MSTWYERGVFYHMYPLGMTGAPRHNDATEVTNRFAELLQWILHIRTLGCNAIYIGPLFESTSHGYDTRDYKLVDRRLGDNESFKDFVKQCHDSGIRVVVDGVFNHTGREFFAFKDIQEKSGIPLTKTGIKGLISTGRAHAGTHLDTMHGRDILNFPVSTFLIRRSGPICLM